MSDRPDIGTPGEEREEFEALHAFTKVMFEKLKANRHKGGWQKCQPMDLYARLLDEQKELHESLVTHFSKDPDAREHTAESVAKECADLANFAMMIADVVGGLRK